MRNVIGVERALDGVGNGAFGQRSGPAQGVNLHEMLTGCIQFVLQLEAEGELAGIAMDGDHDRSFEYGMDGRLIPRERRDEDGGGGRDWF